jgi:hypothetical protein
MLAQRGHEMMDWRSRARITGARDRSDDKCRQDDGWGDADYYLRPSKGTGLQEIWPVMWLICSAGQYEPKSTAAVCRLQGLSHFTVHQRWGRTFEILPIPLE